MKKKILFVCIVIMTILCFSVVALAVSEDEDSGVVNVFFTADVCGQVEQVVNDAGKVDELGYAALKTFITHNIPDGGDVLVLDGGNTFSRSSFAVVDQGLNIAKIMADIGYDAMVLGESDLNYDEAKLSFLQEMSGMHFLSSNLKKDEKPLYEESFIREVSGIKIGVLGITSPQYSETVHNNSDFDYGTKESTLADAQRVVKNLQAGGAEVIIAITHLGDRFDEGLSAEDVAVSVSGLDYIFDGGHVDSENSNLLVKGKTMIIQVGQKMSHVAMLTISKESEILSFKPQVFAANDLKNETPEQNLAQRITQMNAANQEVLGKPVVITPISLLGERNRVLNEDTNLARLLASSYKQAAESQIAFVCGGDIKASIGQGQVTRGNIIEVLPVNDQLVATTLRGEVIVDALNYGLVPQRDAFLHVAGLTVQYEDSDQGPQVVSVLVNGKKLKENKEYVVTMSKFMVDGGYGYDMLSYNGSVNIVGNVQDIFTEYLSQANDELILNIDQEVRMTTENIFPGGDLVILAIIIIACAVLIVIYLILQHRRNRYTF